MKIFLDELTAEQPGITAIIFYIALYVGIIVITQGVNSAIQVLANSVREKANHQYEVNLAEKLKKLPLSVIDTSSARDLIDEVRYSQWAAVI
jgi:ABC-type multidrug transport system fused ATPase/permease subunit